MQQWRAAAHRGQLTVDVLSVRCAVEAGYAVRDGCALLVIVYPDGAEALSCSFVDAERVASWCREMHPRAVRALVADGEDELELRRLLGIAAKLH